MNQHVMHIMDSSGDTSLTWDPANPDSVKRARSEFDRMVRAGYAAFQVEVTSEASEVDVVVEDKGARVTRFDPAAGKLIMVPQRQGG